MSTRRSFSRLLRNPLIVVPPFVLVLGIGWHQYTYAGRELALPDAGLNLLPDSDFHSFQADGLPTGWQVTASGDLYYATGRSQGYANGSSLQLTISGYKTGDTTLAGPKVAITPGKTYMYKAYYRATMHFSLLARTYYRDGSSTLRLVQGYPATDSDWTTVSSAFTAANNAAAVQFVFSAYTNGTLTVNEPYLEASQHVTVPPAVTGANVLPNGSLQAGAYDSPDGWSTYHGGNNTAAFSYVQDTGGAYVQTAVTSYKNGQAKWQYAPQPVTPGQYYSLSLSYRATVSVPIVAEYTLQDGGRQDQTVAALPPADDWTTAVYRFEVPPDAATMFVSLPMAQNGTVASRQLALTNITKPGPAEWQQPLVSITFDDGWQTAFQNALPALQQYGYAATFYINPAAIETSGFMTAAELNILAQSGNEIGAHGFEHDDLTTLNQNTLDYQLSQGRDYLRAAGFQVSDLATPYGRSDGAVQYDAQRYYTTVRGTDTGINTRQNLDPYNLKVLYITETTTLKTIDSALQTAKAEHGWLILVYHQVTDGSPLNKPDTEHAAITTAAFQKQLSAVHASNITVLPVAAAYGKVRAQ